MFFIKQVDSKTLDLCLNKLSLDNSNTLNTSASVISASNQQQQRLNANNLTQLQQNQLTSCFNNNPNNYFYINTGQSNNVVQNKENYIYGKFKGIKKTFTFITIEIIITIKWVIKHI